MRLREQPGYFRAYELYYSAAESKALARIGVNRTWYRGELSRGANSALLNTDRRALMVLALSDLYAARMARTAMRRNPEGWAARPKTTVSLPAWI